MIDIIDHTLAVTDCDEGLKDRNDVLVGQHAIAFRVLAAKAAVELHTAYGGEVVTLAREEQVVEQVLCCFLRRRLTGAHHAVDFHQRLEAIPGAIDAQRVADVGPAVELVRVDRIDHLDVGRRDLI